MLVNITINKDNIITGWTKVPFDYSKPVLEAEDISTIHTGFSLAINPQIKEYKITKLKKVKDETTRKFVEQEVVIKEGTYTCYTLVENKKAYEEHLLKIKELSTQKEYEDLVEKYIRQRYTISQELSLLRQKEDKPEEYSAYYAYAEECKSKAKEEVK